MRKSIVLSVVAAFLLVAGTFSIPSSAQDASKDQTPTFYRLVPGTYVNPWPRFTVTYPKEWVEMKNWPAASFRAGVPAEYTGTLEVYSYHIPLPLERTVDLMVALQKPYIKDLTIVVDKPSRLRDGSPAREMDLKGLAAGGVTQRWLGVATQRGAVRVQINVFTLTGFIGEDLRAIPYTIAFEPEKDKPVTVPHDVREFLDEWCRDHVSHDVPAIMSHYSERYLHSGVRKPDAESLWWYLTPPNPQSPLGTDYKFADFDHITSFVTTVTDFVPLADRTYLAGFIVVNGGTFPLPAATAIINENGRWKWYGNQREVAPMPPMPQR
jgi:hypothetical protein